MSLSLHSSRDALTSSKRGLEKDSDIEPLKSSIGEISSRISASPPTAVACSSGERVARHSGLPISQSNEAVCRASRSGTSRGSWILAKETRSGAPGIFWRSGSLVRVPPCRAAGVLRGAGESVVLGEILVGREPAKMRPSKDLTTCGRGCWVSSWVVVGNGGAARVLSPGGVDQMAVPGRIPGTPGDPTVAGKGVRGQRNRKPYP